MSEMIDRVAKVMCDLDNAHWAVERGRYQARARTVIGAMREPSGGMQADMRDAIEPYVQLGLSKLVSDQWQIGRETWAAGIDGALQEAKG